MIARIAALLLAATLNLPEPVPPRTQGLVAGYHLNAHGCITNVDAGSFMRRGGSPYDSESNAARITRLRRGIHLENETNQSRLGIDLAYRMPLSVALYRTHRVVEARRAWRFLLARDTYATSPHAGTQAALEGKFHDALVAYAMSPPRFNMVTFGDSGAAYNLQRGLNAAARNDLAGAETYLNYSIECSPFFHVPHLALGVIAAMRHDFTTARHEWLADLEGWDPSSPDSAAIATPQYDAMRLLLRYG